jgi:hypothetical protein
MRILAMDQSLSSTGWALWDSGDPLPRSGAWPLCDGGSRRAMGFVQIHREISNIHAEREINILAHETPLKLPTDKLHNLLGTYGLVGHIESIAHVKKCTLYSIAQRDWRDTWFNGMVVTGRVNLKRQAIERARQFGMNPATDDEAEACGMLDHLMHVLKITPPWRLANPLVATLT